MGKDTKIISEIGTFFQEFCRNKAINSIMNVISNFGASFMIASGHKLCLASVITYASTSPYPPVLSLLHSFHLVQRSGKHVTSVRLIFT